MIHKFIKKDEELFLVQLLKFVFRSYFLIIFILIKKKVSNRTTMPLIILDPHSIETNKFNPVIKIDVNQEFYLPIQLLYSKITPRIYFALQE